MVTALKPGGSRRRSPARKATRATQTAKVVSLVPPKPTKSKRTSQPRATPNNLIPLAPANRSTAKRPPAHQTSQVVKSLPRTSPIPSWLRLLIITQRGSSVIMLGLIVATLAIYGWTVHFQQRWGNTYSRYEKLQRQMQQYIEANETLKDYFARQAESPNANLVLPSSDNTILLQPAPVPPIPPVTEVAPLPSAASAPLGY